MVSWNKGEPTAAMWCLVVWLSKDAEPVPRVTMLWFNPSVLPKWWEGIVGYVKPFRFPVLYWSKMPDPPEIDGQDYLNATKTQANAWHI